MPADNLLLFPTPAWQTREQSKLESGEYPALPWADAPWWTGTRSVHGLHFAHVSTDDASKIAYTASEAHGAQDRQVRMKPGKYLKKYFSHVLSDPDIQKLAGEFASENESHELRLARTPDEIEHVYRSGPNSCMAHGADEFSTGGVHPTRAYGAGDLAIAYVQRGDTIGARVVCWPAKRVHCGVVYGDGDRLTPALESAGYTRGSLDGARLLRIVADECTNTFAAPWLDGDASTVDDDGAHLIIRRHGAIPCRNTNGTAGGYPCERCRDIRTEDESYSVGDETWCESCYENHTWYCERCEETMTDDETMVNVCDTSWCESCADTYAYKCERCDTIYPDDGNASAYTVDGDTWCESCADDGAYECETCDTWHENRWRPDANRFANVAQCIPCWRETLDADGIGWRTEVSALIPATCASAGAGANVRRAA